MRGRGGGARAGGAGGADARDCLPELPLESAIELSEGLIFSGWIIRRMPALKLWGFCGFWLSCQRDSRPLRLQEVSCFLYSLQICLSASLVPCNIARTSSFNPVKNNTKSHSTRKSRGK